MRDVERYAEQYVKALTNRRYVVDLISSIRYRVNDTYGMMGILMAEQTSNVVPLRRPEAEPFIRSGEIIRFPGNWEAIDAPEPGADDVNGPRRNWSRFDLIKFVVLVMVVLTPRYWLDWAMRFGVLTTVITGVVVGLTALLIWDDLLFRYHYALTAFFMCFIVSAFYVPFMVPTALMCVLLICIRQRMI